MATLRGSTRALLTVGSALLVLTGCDKLPGGDGASAEFARAALERNDQLTIVAFDKKENTFTVRMKNTGELRVVHADQVVGTLPGAAGDEGKPRPASAPPPASREIAAETSAHPAPTLAIGEVARPVDEVDARNPSPPSSAGSGVITDPRTGTVLASSTADEQAGPATPQGSVSKEAAGDKKVLASGPGYSISAGDRTPPSAIRLASRSSDIPSPARGVALEKRSEPLICQGQRLLHIDRRNLEFEGDGLAAEDGCEIHITNSHIIAHGGVGVSARAANVHIQNSVIEGDQGSISAANGSQIYTQQSTFKGLSRRLDTSSFHDLGGTVWD